MGTLKYTYFFIKHVGGVDKTKGGNNTVDGCKMTFPEKGKLLAFKAWKQRSMENKNDCLLTTKNN